jgi:hypothetical protein
MLDKETVGIYQNIVMRDYHTHCPAPSNFGTRRREGVLPTLGLRL